jgi:hypothetical protein
LLVVGEDKVGFVDAFVRIVFEVYTPGVGCG